MEEARNLQPSIVFFSMGSTIVSTPLALMNGYGQVMVIGAMNPPEAVDSAPRRPGCFDREFYFALPGLGAVLSIMTKKWVGWGGSDKEEEELKERINWRS